MGNHCKCNNKENDDDCSLMDRNVSDESMVSWFLLQMKNIEENKSLSTIMWPEQIVIYCDVNNRKNFVLIMKRAMRELFLTS